MSKKYYDFLHKRWSGDKYDYGYGKNGTDDTDMGATGEAVNDKLFRRAV